MLKKLFDFFLSSYKSETLEIQKKARILLLLIIALIIGILAVYINSIINKALDIKTNIIFLFTFILFTISLILIKKAKYRTASNIFIVCSYIIMNAFLYVEAPVHATNEINTLAFYMMFSFSISLLVCYVWYQVLIASSFGVVSLMAVYFFRASGLPAPEGNPLETTLVSSLILIILSGFFGILLRRLTNDIIILADNESRTNYDRYLKIEALINKSKEGIRIGEKLISSTISILEITNSMSDKLSTVNNEVSTLNTEITDTRTINDQVLSSSEAVKDKTTENIAAVSESSAAIEEMTASITNISEIARDRSKELSDLVFNAKKGEDMMGESIHDMEAISRSTEDLLEVIGVIENIASQTDLLAMNAAIEAAHAGDFGKGFAVVADEIRKLSEETYANTKTISQTLKNTIKDIVNASNKNKTTGTYFQRISDKLKLTADAILEIVKSIDEISCGAKDVLEGITRVMNLSTEVTDSMKNTDSLINKNNKSINSISGFSRKLKEMIEENINVFSRINNEIEKLKNIGETNIKYIEEHDLEMRKIKSSDTEENKIKTGLDKKLETTDIQLWKSKEE